MIAGADFTEFGNHWPHAFSGGGQAVSPVLAYSSGQVELVFEEDHPLQGQRKLRAAIRVSNAEPFQSLIVVLKNENPILRFSGWHADSEFGHPTMAAAIDRRSGNPEIILGVVGGRDVASRVVDLGYIEMDVLTTDALELTADDLALVDARLQEFGGGTLAFSGSQVARVSQPVELDYGLAQNYPNPFNPTTTISYSIREPSHVQLQVYNVRGQLVRTLVDETRTPNVYRVIWDGRNASGNGVASGIYFYRLIAGDFRATKKMVLLR